MGKEIFIVVGVIILFTIPLFGSSKTIIIPTARVSDLELKNMFGESFIPSKFLREQYKAYVRIQEAWMNKEIEKVSGDLDRNLYNQYQTQILTLINANQINVMKDFKYNDSYIINASNENGNKEITTILKVTVKDYITNNDGKLLKGHTGLRVYTYKMIYRCVDKDDTNTCPTCGAPIKDVSSQKCEYCDGTINKKTTSWVLVKKELLKED